MRHLQFWEQKKDSFSGAEKLLETLFGNLMAQPLLSSCMRNPINSSNQKEVNHVPTLA